MTARTRAGRSSVPWIPGATAAVSSSNAAICRRINQSAGSRRAGRVFFDRDGNPSRFAGAILDVTERKQRELEIMRLAKVLDSSRDFIGIANQLGRPVFVNEAGLKLMGLRRHRGGFRPTPVGVLRARAASARDLRDRTLRAQRTGTGKASSLQELSDRRAHPGALQRVHGGRHGGQAHFTGHYHA